MTTREQLRRAVGADRSAAGRGVTADPAPGMKADVMCFAEDIPFEDGSFDAITQAPHCMASSTGRPNPS